jgi:hypothetical protein
MEEAFDITLHQDGLKLMENHVGPFRYQLKIKNKDYEPGHLTVCIVMINPSDKDRNKIGQTIQSIIDGLRSNKLTKDFGEITVVNLSPYKTSDPKNIIYYDVSLNREYIINEIEFSDIVIFAYGNLNDKPIREKLEQESEFVNHITNYFGKEIYCFGKTKNDYPIHPFSIKFTKNYNLVKYLSSDLSSSSDDKYLDV